MRRRAPTSNDDHAPLVIAHFVEHLDSIACSITDMQQFAAIMGIFLNDRVSLTGYPNVSLIIVEATVYFLGQYLAVSPRPYNITGGIEFNHRWRRLGNIRFLGPHIAAAQNEHMVARINAYTAQFPEDPPVR
jgi:hypothetical protein